MLSRLFIIILLLICLFVFTERSHSSELTEYNINLNLKSFFADEEESFIEGESGLKLYKGLNLFSYEELKLDVWSGLKLQIQFQQAYNKDDTTNKIYRGYIKYNFYKFSLEAGKDNINLGPGVYGLVLSDNVEPYPLILLQTEKGLDFIGEWNFIILNGWLLENRSDIDNPEILAIRLSWKPFTFLEFGGTRGEFYGGDSRPGYNVSDYITMVFGAKNNVPGKYDNDGYGGYDITLFIPLERVTPSIKSTKLYVEDIATDIKASWQVEDKAKFKFPGFTMLNHGVKLGLSISDNNNSYGVEYVRTSKDFYNHHIYPDEGYTYNGLSLGYPFGRDIRSIFIYQKHFFEDISYIEYKLGAYEQPYSNTYKNRMRTYYLSILGSKDIGKYTLNGYARIEIMDRYNQNPISLPSQITEISNEDKSFYTVGVSLGYNF